jgi:hypothetical protein
MTDNSHFAETLISIIKKAQHAKIVRPDYFFDNNNIDHCLHYPLFCTDGDRGYGETAVTLSGGRFERCGIR